MAYPIEPTNNNIIDHIIMCKKIIITSLSIFFLCLNTLPITLDFLTLQTYTFGETCCDMVYTILLRCSYRIFYLGIYPMNRCDGRGELVLSFVFYYTSHIHNIFVIPFSPYSIQRHFYAMPCIVTRPYSISICYPS